MPDAIVPIHGPWMTPLSWERWAARFSDQGHDEEYAARSHFAVGQERWEAVADHAIDWAVAQAATRAVPH